MSPIAKDLSHLPSPAKTSTDGHPPDPEPRFVHLLAEQWAADRSEAGPNNKPRATERSRFRHSDAANCSRAIAYAALDVPASDPMDLTGVWNTRLGTLIHDAWQAVIAERYPTARIEPKVESVDGDGSGHIDAVFPDGTVIAFELKSCGGFAYKMAVGERGAAQGPKHAHIVQGALNAKAVDADELVVGYLSKEAISVAAAERKGISELGRFCAEWTYTRDQFMPLADAEERRIAGILGLLDEGTLPARKVPDPELPAGHVIVDPTKKGQWQVHDESGGIVDAGSWWGCDYCRWQTVCAGTEADRQPLADVAVHLGLEDEAVAS